MAGHIASPDRARAAVGVGAPRELAVELGQQRDAVGDAKLPAGRNERRVLHRERAVDDEARAGKRLKNRLSKAVGIRQKMFVSYPSSRRRDDVTGPAALDCDLEMPRSESFPT